MAWMGGTRTSYISNNRAKVPVPGEVGGVGTPVVRLKYLTDLQHHVIRLPLPMVDEGRDLLHHPGVAGAAKLVEVRHARRGPLVATIEVDLERAARNAHTALLDVPEQMFVMGQDDHLKTPVTQIFNCIHRFPAAVAVVAA